MEGESPTVDMKDSLQQTVMNQDRLEGVPTGRDPWSAAKNVVGGQVGKYDVGGTQGMQQQNISAHGSDPNDKVFAIDGLSVNWPGGGGGSTMIYYDQGMFQETNYQTSAIPAEVLVGGVYMNMVTKQGGNRWGGGLKTYYANDGMQIDNHQTPELEKWNFPGGNTIITQYDINVDVGGPIVTDKVWWFSGYRRWRVDQLTLGAKNPDGSAAKDDNLIQNYVGKITWQIGKNHKTAVLYNYNHKERFHRRDVPPDFVEDRASWYQNNPGYSTQINYWGVYGNAAFRSVAGVMSGVTDYRYQTEVLDTDIRIEDPIRNTATVAAQRHNTLPNYRAEWTNVFQYNLAGPGGQHLIKAGASYWRMWMDDKFWVNGDKYLIFNDGVPNSVRIFNTPTHNLSYTNAIGLFLQDSWNIGTKIALNLGLRYDRLTGTIPATTAGAGAYIGARELAEIQPLNQHRAVWRAGVVYDPFGGGKTALKVNYSRYAAQAGLNRLQLVNPFQFQNATRSWSDVNGDKLPQENEMGPSSGFPGLTSRYSSADGPDWPYSDEITVGVERELFADTRVAVLYYHRTNRMKTGYVNAKVPRSAYTAVTVPVPGGTSGPGGTATFYNLDRAFFGQAFADQLYDNQPLLNTSFDGFEFTFSKRLSHRWQVLAAGTFGKNVGGVALNDLSDPNNSEVFPTGIVGDDSRFAFKVSGSYEAPYGFTLSGNVLYNQGYPYQSSYTITRAIYPNLTRASQAVVLSERGAERLPNVFLADLRVSRTFRLPAGRSVTPQVEFFNLSNAATVTRLTTSAGSSYLRPSEILAPFVVRVGLGMKF
jgi:hypothetical protein